MSEGQNRDAVAELATLRTLIKGVAENQDRQDKQFTEFREETRRDISEIAKSVNAMGKMSWPTILSVITTSIVVGGILIGFIEMRNAELRNDINDNELDLHEHSLIEHHPKTAIKLTEHGGQIGSLAVEVGKLEGNIAADMSEFRAQIRTETDLKIGPLSDTLGNLEHAIAGLGERIRSIESSRFNATDGRQLNDRLNQLTAEFQMLRATTRQDPE